MSKRNNFFGSKTSLTARTIAFLAATGISDTTIANALNTMDLALIANGLDTKMKALYPFVGGTATTHKFNFMNPADTNAAHRIFWAGGITHSATGVLFNGTTGYGNTNIIPSTTFSSLATSAICYYSRTSAIVNGQRDFSAFTSSGPPSMSIGTNTGAFISDNLYYATNRLSAAIANALGLLMGSRVSTTDHRTFKNGVQIGSTDVADNGPQPGLPTIPLFIGAANVSASGATSASNFSTKEVSFAAASDGLTTTEAANLYTLVQNLQTSLSRNV